MRTKQRFCAELSIRRRAQDQPLQSVYNNIRCLVSLPFPGEHVPVPGSVYEMVACDAFLSAIDNSVIKQKMLEWDPPPDILNAALTAALHLEALDVADSQVSSNRPLLPNYTEAWPHVQPNAADNNREDYRFEAVASHMQVATCGCRC